MIYGLIILLTIIIHQEEKKKQILDFRLEFILNHLINDMKKFIFILLFSLALTIDVPYFDGNKAYDYLVKQRDFGYR